MAVTAVNYEHFYGDDVFCAGESDINVNQFSREITKCTTVDVEL